MIQFTVAKESVIITQIGMKFSDVFSAIRGYRNLYPYTYNALRVWIYHVRQTQPELIIRPTY